MKKKSFIFLLFIFIISLTACGGVKVKKQKLKEISVLSDNHFECLYDGIKHDFIIDLPANPEGATLIVMLPGWGNLAETLRFSTQFSEDANPRGYAVVYVTGSINKYESGGNISWNSGISAKGNDDVGFLIALAEYLQKEYKLDRDRTFAVGFSNGAFMIHRLAMEAGKTFSACVSVAGFMPEMIWNQRNKKNHVSFFQITGEFDDVVPKHSDGTAAYTKNPAIEDVMLYWAYSNKLYASESAPIGNDSRIIRWTYADDDWPKNVSRSTRPVHVWSLFIKDGRHSWPEKRISGIDVNSLILDFFAEN